MKRKIISVFAALLMLACLAAGCNRDGNVRDPLNPGGQTVPDNGDFTVSLVLNGEPYVPQGNVTASWDDGMSRPVTAAFDSNGVARAAGLDGDYTVRVSGLPEKYTFDPNSTVATNYNRKINLDIYEAVVLPEQKAPAYSDVLYEATELKMGSPDVGAAYRITFNSPFETYYCLYQPRVAGMYTVRSLVDITENAVNPKYQICSGTRHGARYAGAVLDGGGASGTYTVNFDYETGFNYDELGGILLFGVRVETRSLDFPIALDILVKRTGDYVRRDIMSNLVLPTEFDRVKPDSSYNGEEGYTSATAFKIAQDAFMRGDGALGFKMFHETRFLDGDLVAFNEATGYFHLYNRLTGEYGAVVCAKITRSCGVLEMPFNTVEYQGNKALTIDDNYDKYYKKTKPKYNDKEYHYLNYKVFIEGFDGISAHEDVYPGITAQYSAYEGVYGYADFCNADGVYPVNKELQRFLQGYATNARLFMDGNGFAETDAANPLMSAEEDQWMFACGYYA